MRTGQKLYSEAKKIIPGGTQLLSKRPEMFLPENWPAYYSKASGIKVWDLDYREYLDFSFMGIGACILGYADPEVNAAVENVVKSGNMTTLNAPEELELARLLLKLHPWAEMVRYARSGGEAMAIAVRIARAATRKEIILFCGYHGWHDWYLSANLSDDNALDGQLLPGLSPNGVCRGLKGTTFPFKYNDSATFLELLGRYKDKVAGIVIESIRNIEPDTEFLQCIQEAANSNDIPLIVDEVSSGFRLNLGGAHLILGIKPDIAVFAKGISNGFPMAAIIGTRRYMDASQDTFISSTYWTDRIGPTAAIATIDKMRRCEVQKKLVEIGKSVQTGWKEMAEKADLAIEVGSIYPLSHFEFSNKDPLVCKTLYTQEMLERGFLATNSFYASFAHSDPQIEEYLDATFEVFAIISKAIRAGNLHSLLKGPVCQTGFKRLS